MSCQILILYSDRKLRPFLRSLPETHISRRGAFDIKLGCNNTTVTARLVESEDQYPNFHGHGYQQIWYFGQFTDEFMRKMNSTVRSPRQRDDESEPIMFIPDDLVKKLKEDPPKPDTYQGRKVVFEDDSMTMGEFMEHGREPQVEEGVVELKDAASEVFGDAVEVVKFEINQTKAGHYVELQEVKYRKYSGFWWVGDTMERVSNPIIIKDLDKMYLAQINEPTRPSEDDMISKADWSYSFGSNKPVEVSKEQMVEAINHSDNRLSLIHI